MLTKDDVLVMKRAAEDTLAFRKENGMTRNSTAFDDVVALCADLLAARAEIEALRELEHEIRLEYAGKGAAVEFPLDKLDALRARASTPGSGS